MMPPPSELTTQGFDLQFGTNVIGPFYFTKLLLPTLLQTAKAMSMSSEASRSSGLYPIGNETADENPNCDDSGDGPRTSSPISGLNVWSKGTSTVRIINTSSVSHVLSPPLDLDVVRPKDDHSDAKKSARKRYTSVELYGMSKLVRLCPTFKSYPFSIANDLISLRERSSYQHTSIIPTTPPVLCPFLFTLERSKRSWIDI
jgi:NAD(P)-dependent dehydrogenase (short-subunit alcohol dehydrogenase family)